MQTGIISFGDRVAWNIKCNHTKDLILDEIYTLYGIRIIQKHYYKIDENNIKHLTKVPHFISLRTNGNRYYIYFTKYNDVEIIYFIDMKIHTGYEKPRIILGRGLFAPSLFLNTLLEGEMVKTKDSKWIFIINDIIAYERRKLDDLILPKRLELIYNILNDKYTPDETCDICTYQVKSYYYLSKESLKDLLKQSEKLNYTSRGLYFYSYYLKHKPKLINFDDKVIVDVKKKIKDITEFKSLISPSIEDKKQSSFIITSNLISQEIKNEEYKELWVSKTDDADIYNLYDNYNIMTSNKIGIALVPTLKDSIYLRNLFKDKNLSDMVKLIVDDPVFIAKVESSVKNILKDGKVDQTDIPEFVFLIMEAYNTLPKARLTKDELPPHVHIYDTYPVYPDTLRSGTSGEHVPNAGNPVYKYTYDQNDPNFNKRFDQRPDAKLLNYAHNNMPPYIVLAYIMKL